MSEAWIKILIHWDEHSRWRSRCNVWSNSCGFRVVLSGLYSCTFGTASFARVVAVHNCYEARYLIVYSCVNSMVAGNLQGNEHSLHTRKSLCKFKKRHLMGSYGFYVLASNQAPNVHSGIALPKSQWISHSTAHPSWRVATPVWPHCHRQCSVSRCGACHNVWGLSKACVWRWCQGEASQYHCDGIPWVKDILY